MKNYKTINITARVDILAVVPEELNDSKEIVQDFLELVFDKWFGDQKYESLSVVYLPPCLKISMVVKATVIQHKIKGDRDTPDDYEHSDLVTEFDHSIPQELIKYIEESIEDLNP